MVYHSFSGDTRCFIICQSFRDGKSLEQRVPSLRPECREQLTSAGGMAMPGSDVVTLLFTDLVGSTDLSQKVGDDAADALRRVMFKLLREAVAAGGGREVKTAGDG